MIKIDFNIQFVSEIKSAETVGTENYKASIGEDDTPINIDLTKAAAALGVTVEDLVNEDNGYFKVQLLSGIFTNTNVSLSSGYTFGMDGNYDAGGNGALGISYTDKGFVTYSNSTIEGTFSITTTFCFEVNEKQYVFNVTVMDSKTYTGINDIKAKSDKTGKIYNLQGMEIKHPVKGQVYIQNGKKVIK